MMLNRLLLTQGKGECEQKVLVFRQRLVKPPGRYNDKDSENGDDDDDDDGGGGGGD